MIFVTVGTHEQGMDRLFIELDRLIAERVINDEIFAQIGYTKYKPKNFEYKSMIGYDEMENWIKRSDIIITHGGPGSIFHPLKYKKIPIVFPRDPKFNEHVDNHQILFTKRLEKQNKIIAVYQVEDLKETLIKYEIISRDLHTHSDEVSKFIKKFDNLIETKLF